MIINIPNRYLVKKVPPYFLGIYLHIVNKFRMINRANCGICKDNIGYTYYIVRYKILSEAINIQNKHKCTVSVINIIVSQYLTSHKVPNYVFF